MYLNLYADIYHILVSLFPRDSLWKLSFMHGWICQCCRQSSKWDATFDVCLHLYLLAVLEYLVVFKSHNLRGTTFPGYADGMDILTLAEWIIASRFDEQTLVIMVPTTGDITTYCARPSTSTVIIALLDIISAKFLWPLNPLRAKFFRGNIFACYISPPQWYDAFKILPQVR